MVTVTGGTRGAELAAARESASDWKGEFQKERQRANALADRCGQLQHERDEAIRRAEVAEAKVYRLERGKR